MTTPATQPSKRVQQEDANGCVVASLAMVTGKTYQQVCAEMQEHVGNFIDGQWVPGCDFALYGISVAREAIYYLSTKGFAVQLMPQYDGRTNQPRSPWPVLWVQPGNPLFIGYLATVALNNKQHCIVVDEHGTVLDPWREGQYKLSDYSEVTLLAAVFKAFEQSPGGDATEQPVTESPEERNQ